jgi:hypothetical protein
MTLTLSQINHGDLCHGWSWVIQDEEKLAQQVARVALGQFRHVSKILAGVETTDPTTTHDHAADAIDLLTVLKGDDPWHRDGWIFQTISWLAAHQQSHGAVTRPPHIIKAHKGFDGLQLQLTEDGKSIVAVTIFEDKATDNPRETIRKDVWPGITALESGKRVNQLTHDVSAALEAQKYLNPELDIDAAINNILWKEARRYRVSITVGETHSGPQARKRLFKGFDDSAPGHVDRRRAETIHIPELRKWMQTFADRAIQQVKALVPDV